MGGPCDNSVSKDQVYAPYDGKQIGTAPVGGKNEVMAAVEAADDAFNDWKKSPVHERQKLLRAIATKVRENEQELVDLLSQEVGKPKKASKGEVHRLAITFDIAADILTTDGGEALPVDFDPRGDDYRCFVKRFPIGPIFGVVPYNWPFNLAAHKIAPALASGNTIVIRSSKRSPLSTLLLGRFIHEAGCPDGVVNVLNCGHDEAELAMKDDRIKKLSFTGSPSVGWKLKELVPRKKVSLELGGNAYAVVRKDADLDWAIPRIAQGGFLYAGQICISVQNVRIEKSIYDDARERLVEETKKIKHGDPMDDEVISGPVIDSDAGDKIMEWLEEAESAGAEIIAGGNRTGSVIEPTLIENVPTDKRAVCEEIFGPVLTVAPFESYDEVLAEINSSQYGIHTGVFTDSIVSAHKAFDSLDVAGVIVNDFPTLRFDNFPYGGVKNSGFGREGVKYAMQEMTELKTMVTKVR